MKVLVRTVFVLAAAALTAFAGTGVAAADGDTEPQVAKAIELQAWVPIDVGDRGYRVAFVRCALDEFGYYPGCAPLRPNGDLYRQDMVDAVKRFQRDVYIDVDANGTVTPDTWSELRHKTGVVGPGDSRHQLVKGIQYAMKKLQDPDLAVDGYYGPATKDAVGSFQERKQIGVDGYFGPQTFRAAFAEGAEQRLTPGL